MDPIDIPFTNIPPKQTISYASKHDIVFNHTYIEEEMSNHQLTFQGCNLCSKLVNHLADPRTLIDKVSETKICWIKRQCHDD